MSQKITLELTEWQAQVIMEILGEVSFIDGPNNLNTVIEQLKKQKFDFNDDFMFYQISKHDNWAYIVSKSLQSRISRYAHIKPENTIKFIDENGKEELIDINTIKSIEEICLGA